jgi:5-methylcytosine-specific restriction protein B
MCTFHPGYGYEDFLEGYRPDAVNDRLAFSLRDGLFKRLCSDAQDRPDRRFYLIVDEINRGDIPRIFGELLSVMEWDKRGKSVMLPLSGSSFRVPSNVYLVGTMNTADRSIALLDTALRRRFGFVELMPDSSILGSSVVDGIPLALWLDSLNDRVREFLGRDARNLQVGHSYLMEGGKPISDFVRFARVVRGDVIPLLEEYCYEDYSTLERILGNGLIDSNRQRIREELFEDARRDDLVQALLAPDPDLIASTQAITSDGIETEVNEDDSDDSE